jgi:hypothetical protein
VDQAKAAGVKLFVWSALDSLGDLTNGRYPVPFFDTKAAITEHVKASGIPYALVQSGFYFSNFVVSSVPVFSVMSKAELATNCSLASVLPRSSRMALTSCSFLFPLTISRWPFWIFPMTLVPMSELSSKTRNWVRDRRF